MNGLIYVGQIEGKHGQLTLLHLNGLIYVGQIEGKHGQLTLLHLNDLINVFQVDTTYGFLDIEAIVKMLTNIYHQYIMQICLCNSANTTRTMSQITKGYPPIPHYK